MNIKTLVMAASLLLAMSLFEGCTTSASFGEAKTAVVCPQCKMVETVIYLPAGPSFSWAGVGAYGVADLGYPLQKIDDDSWAVELALPPGRYEYRLVVDGVWCTIPTQRS